MLIESVNMWHMNNVGWFKMCEVPLRSAVQFVAQKNQRGNNHPETCSHRLQAVIGVEKYAQSLVALFNEF